MSKHQAHIIQDKDDGLRLDRWFKLYHPSVKFGQLQKLLRSGQVRVDGRRVKGNVRLEEGQSLRLPPFLQSGAKGMGEQQKPLKRQTVLSQEEIKFVRSLVLFEDDDLLIFNKPSGLASQGGSKTKDHLDRLLEAFGAGDKKPRLVHRLDKDTSGLIVAAKSRKVAAYMGKLFQTRSVRKIYWAVTYGVPKPRQGEISCFLAKRQSSLGEKMIVVAQGAPGAVHSKSYYSVIEAAGQKFSWVSLKPVTGRTHQLRVHMNELKVPLIGDGKYFVGFQLEEDHKRTGQLHLHARRLVIPQKGKPPLDLTAPLPPHMRETFNQLGFDPDRYDRQLEDLDEGT